MKSLTLTIFLILIAFSFCLAQNEKGDTISLDVEKITKEWETIKADFLTKLCTDKSSVFKNDDFIKQNGKFTKVKDRIMALTFEGNFDVFLKEDIWNDYSYQQTKDAYAEVANKYIAEMNEKYKMEAKCNAANRQEIVDSVWSTISDLKAEMSKLKNVNYPLSAFWYWLALIISPLLCIVFIWLYLKEKFTGKKTNGQKSKEESNVSSNDNLSNEITLLKQANTNLQNQLIDLQKKNSNRLQKYNELVEKYNLLAQSKSGDKTLSIQLKNKDSEIDNLQRQVSELQRELDTYSQPTTESQTAATGYKYLRQFNNGYFSIVQDNNDGQSLYRMFNIKENGTADFEFYGNEKILLANWSSMLMPICEFNGDPTKAEHVENDKRHPGKLVFDNAINRWKVDKKAHVILS